MQMDCFLECILEAKPPFESCLSSNWVTWRVKVTPSKGQHSHSKHHQADERQQEEVWVASQGGRVSFPISTQRSKEEMVTPGQSDYTHSITERGRQRPTGFNSQGESLQECQCRRTCSSL